MSPVSIRGLFLLIAGFFLGIIAASYTQAIASSQDVETDLSKKTFLVSVDEVKQKFVLADEFTGSYSRTFELSDGSVRTIKLTPMVHNGMQVVEFYDTGGITYMDFNGSTTNGKLMVQLRDKDVMYAELEKQGFDFSNLSDGQQGN